MVFKIKNTKNRKPYWFITVFEKLEISKPGPVDTGCKRCMGFFLNKQIALDVLHTNSTDMHEFCYDYAVLEKYYDGLLEYGAERQFLGMTKKKTDSLK